MRTWACAPEGKHVDNSFSFFINISGCFLSLEQVKVCAGGGVERCHCSCCSQGHYTVCVCHTHSTCTETLCVCHFSFTSPPARQYVRLFISSFLISIVSLFLFISSFLIVCFQPWKINNTLNSPLGSEVTQKFDERGHQSTNIRARTFWWARMSCWLVLTFDCSV